MFSSLPDPPNLPKQPWECPLHKFPEYDFKKCSCPPCKKNAHDGWDSTSNPHHDASNLPVPRVRKEWREHTKDEIDRYACALNVMSTISTEAGRKCYGRTYVYFPDIVMKHACVASDPRGDQGHRGPEFMLFHKSTLLTYEGSILAIDPKIKAIPWWNMPLDSAPVLDVNGTVKHKAGKYYCPKNDSTSHPFGVGSPEDDPSVANPGCNRSKYIWSDTYFGEQLGSGPSYEVTNGRWAYRTMARWGDFDTTYWSQDDKHNVNNECIVNRYFTPQSAMPIRSTTGLRKNPSFYKNQLDPDTMLLTHDQLNQNCVRCCDVHKDGTDVNCMCQPDEHVDIYMRGPTLDTQTCSPYVTRNPNGRGDPMLKGTVGRTIINGVGNASNILFGGNGRSQQDSLIRYTQHDFDACANSNNTRNWIEWQNCQEENEAGSLEGVYCPAGKETCTQQDLEKVYALHSTGHDKTLGEIGDVTTSPSDPALFFSYHAYIDKNFMEWQESMKKEGRFVDHLKLELNDQEPPGPGLSADYFGYPRQATHEEWLANVEAFEKVPFIEKMVNASDQRMKARSFIVPVTFKNFDIELWKDLLGTDADGDAPTAWVPIFPPYNTEHTPLLYDTSTPEGQKNLSRAWRDAATLTPNDSIAIYHVHAGVDPDDSGYNTRYTQDVYDGSVTDPNFLGPACSSATNVHSPDKYNIENGEFPGYQSGKAAAGAVGGGGGGVHHFNPTFSGTCTSPQFPSPKPGSLTYNLTQGARTYSTSGPFIYMTQYRPKDFFNRGDQADPTLPWIPGTLLRDIANGGIPFRDIFPKHDGGTFGYSNQEIMEWGMPCFPGRSPHNKSAPCSPYSYSAVQRPFDEIMKSDAYYTDLHNGRHSDGKKSPVCKVFNTKGEASSVLNALSDVSKPCPYECGACCCTELDEPPALDHVCHFPRSEDGTGDCSLYTPP